MPMVVVDTGSRLLGVMGPDLNTVDLRTRENIGPPPGVTAGPSEVALSPDGSTLAVANQPDQNEGGLALIDVGSGHVRLALKPLAFGPVNQVSFSPDGRYVLASVTAPGTSRAVVWDTTTGEGVFASIAELSATITRLAMSPSNHFLAVGLDDGQVDMWSPSDVTKVWSPLDLQTLHHDDITSLDFDSQSKRLVSTSRDGVAIVWDTATGDVVAGPQAFGGAGGTTTFYRPESATNLVNIDSNGHTVDWELPTQGLAHTVLGVNLGATVSSSPGNILPVSTGTGVTVHDPSGGPPRQVRAVGPRPSTNALEPIRGAATSEDGKRLVVVQFDGQVELHDADSGDLLSTFDDRVRLAAYERNNHLANREMVVALDRNGTRVAYAANRDEVEVVDDKGSVIFTIDVPPDALYVQALDLSEDGSELVVSMNTGEATWYAVDGTATATLAPAGTGFDAQFTADGRVAVVGAGGAQIIDPRSRQTTTRLLVGNDATRFAADSTGRLFATADPTGGIQLWDAALALRIGAAIHVQSAHSAVPIHFSSDGHYLIVSGELETTWIDVRTDDWSRIACDLVTDPLSAEERARFLGSRDEAHSCP